MADQIFAISNLPEDFGADDMAELLKPIRIIGEIRMTSADKAEDRIKSIFEKCAEIAASHHHGGICKTSRPCVACLIEKEIRQLTGNRI